MYCLTCNVFNFSLKKKNWLLQYLAVNYLIINLNLKKKIFSETIRRSYLLQYTKETTNSKNQRHIAMFVYLLINSNIVN